MTNPHEREPLPELPQGFSWQDLPSIRASFPIPEGWHFKEESRGDTRAFFITRESIERQGSFDTGLTVNAFLNFRQSTGFEPSVYARDYMTTQREMESMSEIVAVDDGSLTTYRRHFRARTVGGRRVRPINLYTEATGNDETGTAYLILFESPSFKWPRDATIGETMINNRVLDKHI